MVGFTQCQGKVGRGTGVRTPTWVQFQRPSASPLCAISHSSPLPPPNKCPGTPYCCDFHGLILVQDVPSVLRNRNCSFFCSFAWMRWCFLSLIPHNLDYTKKCSEELATIYLINPFHHTSPFCAYSCLTYVRICHRFFLCPLLFLSASWSLPLWGRTWIQKGVHIKPTTPPPFLSLIPMSWDRSKWENMTDSWMVSVSWKTAQCRGILVQATVYRRSSLGSEGRAKPTTLVWLQCKLRWTRVKNGSTLGTQ